MSQEVVLRGYDSSHVVSPLTHPPTHCMQVACDLHRSPMQANPSCCCHCCSSHRSDHCCLCFSNPHHCLAPCPLSCPTLVPAQHNLLPLSAMCGMLFLTSNPHQSSMQANPLCCCCCCCAIGQIFTASTPTLAATLAPHPLPPPNHT
jgi:hypothetical protein